MRIHGKEVASFTQPSIHCRFAHLVESVDVGNLEPDEVQQRLSDHIVELERETGNCVKLHSIP